MRGLRSCDGKFIPPLQKFRFTRDLCDLAHDITKDWIGRRERNAPFDLDFEDRGISLCVMRVNNDVIQRMPLGSPLEFYAIDGCSRQSAGFGAHEQGQQVRGTDLAFKVGACGSCRCGARPRSSRIMIIDRRLYRTLHFLRE